MVNASSPDRPRRYAVVGAAVGLLLIAAAVFAWIQTTAPRGPLAPDFTLTDQNGQPYTLSSHRGDAIALFFGYTHCPDVCPTTLAALARAKKSLGASGQRLVVVFVTVDPQRDSTAVLRKYVHIFDPSFVGLSGTLAQLEPVYTAYHVYRQKLPAENKLTGYLMAHSSTIDFIAPNGHIRGFGDWSDTSAQLAADMKEALS